MEIKKNENEPDLLASKNLYIFKTQISYGITCLNYLCIVTSPNRKGVILVGGNLNRNHKIIKKQRCIQTYFKNGTREFRLSVFLSNSNFKSPFLNFS